MDRRVARKLIVDKAPNRLFLEYLAEWRDEAKKRGEKSTYTYSKAYKSLKKYPLPLQNGAEAKILEHFGTKICKMLDDRLAKDAEEKNTSPFELLEKSRKVPSSWWNKINSETVVASKKPTKRKKVDQNAEKIRKKSKTQPTIKQAFQSSTGLISPEDPSNEVSSQSEDYESQQSSATSSQSTEDTFVLLPGQFDIILCVDVRETMRESRKNEIAAELKKQNVSHENRSLNLGDFLWIAREKPAFSAGRKLKELVLDYIIERKILSDLSSSIRDGRFREQKIRLKNSGVSNIIYLIENIKKIGNQSIPEQTLRQAIYNTQIVDGINVKYSTNSRSTVNYLNIMTTHLQKLYENCVLQSTTELDSQEIPLDGTHKLVPFSVFNEFGSKQKKLTVNEMFLRQLMQIYGMSYDKASAVTSVYGTPSLLVKKYESLETEREKEELLSKIKTGITERNLGIAMSRTIFKLFSPS